MGSRNLKHFNSLVSLSALVDDVINVSDAQRKQPDKLESDMFNIAENSWRASFRRKKVIRDLQGLENLEPLHPEEKHDPSKGLIGNQPGVYAMMMVGGRGS